MKIKLSKNVKYKKEHHKIGDVIIIDKADLKEFEKVGAVGEVIEEDKKSKK